MSMPTPMLARPYARTPVLVLGASGFIGRWVARQLTAAGAELVCAARDVEAMTQIARRYGIDARIELVDVMRSADLRTLFQKTDPAITFNLLGYGIDRAERDEAVAMRINAEVVSEIATLVQQSSREWLGQRLVHVGSALEYGALTGELSEDRDAAPTTLYGRTKLAGTDAVRRLAASHAVTARLFTVYGPGEHPGRLLPTLLAAQHGSAAIPLSSGTQSRDFTFVADVAEGLLRLGACHEPAHRLVNLATGVTRTVRQFVDTAATVLGLEPTRLHFGTHPALADEMGWHSASTARLHRTIGWVPATTIAQGIGQSAACRALADTYIDAPADPQADPQAVGLAACDTSGHHGNGHV